MKPGILRGLLESRNSRPAWVAEQDPISKENKKEDSL
jgi:hypothetical protein